MNEDEWLTGTDFTAHARYAAEHLSPRRQRLLAVAFCRAAGDLLDHPDLTDALDVIDQYADGRVPGFVVERARQECRTVAQELYAAYRRAIDANPRGVHAPGQSEVVCSELAWAVSFAATSPLPLEMVGARVLSAVVQARTGAVEVVPAPTAAFSAATAAQHLAMRGAVWEVVGTPFRPHTFNPEWRTDTVQSLTTQMYESRDFGAMPILADALQDAGCDDEQVLTHCRTEAMHVRGCWVVDLVLGKE
jgi:hypothetical protein